MVAEPTVSSTDPPTNARIHPFTRWGTLASREEVYSDALNRERGDEPPPEWLIDGLLPQGVMVLIADPGAGKSYVVQQMLHHLCYGRPLGDWDSPGLGGHLAWVADLEGDAGLTRERSYAITPYRELAGDGNPDRDDLYLWYTTWVVPPRDREAYATYRTRAEQHLAYLVATLDDAAAAGSPISVVVIDTLQKFVGPKPRTANAYEWEADVVGQLNRVATDRGISVILIHHTNKAGEVSGSQGIAGSATVACKLDTTRNDETDQVTGVLRSLKVRGAPSFAYPMEQNDDGTWTFTDTLTPAEAGAVGNARRVLAELAKGPRSRAELRPLGIGASLGKTLDRLRRRGEIRTRFGRWELAPQVDGAGREVRTRPGREVRPCPICNEPMTITSPEQTAHPTCDPVAQVDEVAQMDGFRLMVQCIGKSRMHPILRIRESDRGAPPWTLITEQMTGEHRWTRAQLPLAGAVAVLDRSGSYPSAAGSVPVAANLLSHTGELAELEPGVAGIFLIAQVPWDDQRIGHPMGKLGAAEGPVWVTTPHLVHLFKLAGAGVIGPPVILDSWTGRGTGGLFTAFSKAVRDAREKSAGDPEQYTAVKRRSSIALRSLWPKGARSPFWRPDWSVSIRAEASVRHWVRAWEAVQGGAELVAMGSVDEVAFVAPDGSDASWVPSPYRIGTGFGEVKHKPVKIGEELVPSPMPLEVWSSRHQGRRKR